MDFTLYRASNYKYIFTLDILLIRFNMNKSYSKHKPIMLTIESTVENKLCKYFVDC